MSAVSPTNSPQVDRLLQEIQKGAVENLVKFVKSNFLPGRSFYDDLDLGEQCKHWLRQVNTECPSDATGEPPAVLLAQEQPQYGPLPTQGI